MENKVPLSQLNLTLIAPIVMADVLGTGGDANEDAEVTGREIGTDSLSTGYAGKALGILPKAKCRTNTRVITLFCRQAIFL